MAKFYDSVSFPLLVRELKTRNYTAPLLVLVFFVHACPRILRVGPSFGPLVHSCGNSMLAGCQQSTSFARGLLYELVQQLSVIYPDCPVHEHVDDLSHVLIGETESDLKSKLLAPGRVVGHEV